MPVSAWRMASSNMGNGSDGSDSIPSDISNRYETATDGVGIVGDVARWATKQAATILEVPCTYIPRATGLNMFAEARALHCPVKCCHCGVCSVGRYAAEGRLRGMLLSNICILPARLRP